MYKHIFLDFDDTIYDTKGNATEALSELYEAFDLGAYFDDFQTFSTHYWKRNHEVWALYSQGKMKKDELIVERFLYPFRLVGKPVDEDFAMQLHHWFMDRSSQKSGLVQGALDLLIYLNSKYEVHMLSNGFEQVQYRKMDYSGVRPYFKEVILSDHIGVNKPDKALFDYALQKIGAQPAEVIMIGDNFDTDIIGAINSQIDQLFFNISPDFRAPQTPTYEVRHLAQIKDIL